jgi:hypothetical protein
VPRRNLIIFTAVYFFACVAYFIWSILITEPGFPLDDSWIHLVFASNIANGHGFSFNPGHPVAGATAPLWTLLLVPFWWLLGPVAGGIIPGVLLECLAIIAIYKLTVLLICDEKLAFLVALATSLSWVLVWGGLSGMEVGLYSALSLWGLYFYFKADSFHDSRNYVAYILFVLAILSRPECALFLAAVAIRDFVVWVRSQDKSLLPWLWRILIVIVLLTPYIAFNYSTTGTLFPQTFTAKVRGRGFLSAIADGEIGRILKTLTILPVYHAENFMVKMSQLNPIIMLAFIPGLIKIWPIRDSLRSKRIMLIILLLLYVPLMGMFSPVMNSTYQNMRRVDNLIPLIFMFGFAGLFYKSDSKSHGIKRTLEIIMLFVSIIGVTLIFENDFWSAKLAPFLEQNFLSYKSGNLSEIAVLVREIGIEILVLSIVFLSGLNICTGRFQYIINGFKFRNAVIGLVIAYSIAFLVYGANQYSNNVKNINECDKAAGLYLKNLAKPGDIVAANDIGAIKYFSNMEILDLKGLVSPEITPAMIIDDSLAYEYMYHNKRVDYLAIFPNWFTYIPKPTSIFKPITSFVTSRNTTLAGDMTVVYKAVWPDSTR